jgi:hypothetical protein
MIIGQDTQVCRIFQTDQRSGFWTMKDANMSGVKANIFPNRKIGEDSKERKTQNRSAGEVNERAMMPAEGLNIGYEK